VPDARGGGRRDVEREIELHLELRAREFEAAGMSPEDARRAALDAFGDRGAVTTEVAEIHRDTVRRRERREWLSELRQDLVVGLRMLRRTPGFTAVALLTLALGIGANTAIFGVLRSVLLRPLPYPHAEQLVQIWSDHRARGRAEPEWMSPADFIDWRAENTTFSAMAAYNGWGPDLTGDGEPEALRGIVVSGNYFDVLGAKADAGRLLTMADDDENAARVVVLSHAFWARRFGAERSVIGKTLTLSGNQWTVVGVLPDGLRLPTPAGAPDVIAALRRPANSRCGRGCIVWHAIGRMKPGVSLAVAQADLGRVAARIAKEFPSTNDKVSAWLVPLHEQITGPTRPALLTVSAAVAFVLLIGCVNLANLLLVRGAAREREIGVRAALGAGRGRVIRQLLTENALLAVAGGVLGLTVGAAGTRALDALVPAGVRQVQEIRIDGYVLAFTALITLASAAVFGLVPAVHATRARLVDSLRTTGTHSGRQANALRASLVVTQLSLAVVLLVGAGLLLRSFLMMQHVDLGFRDRGVYLTSVGFPRARYPDPARTVATIEDLLARLRANPAVKTAEATDLPPLAGGGDQDMTAIPVGSTPKPGRSPSIWYRSVSPGYPAAMHMRLVAGRALDPADRAGAARVGLVNEEAARDMWPNQNPVGREIATGDAPDAPRIRIVGVLAAAHSDGANQPYKPELFLPIEQSPAGGVTLVLEPTRDVASLAAALRETLHRIDPLVPVGALEPVEQLVGDTVALPRLYAMLVGMFAATALLLATLGVYGVMAYSVAQRRREIGVRLALGAAPAHVARMVMQNGGRLAAIGVLLGLAGAVLVGRAISKLLFGVTPYDAPTFVLVPLVLGLATVVAAWLPARRAMRVDPLVAIREE
jgi:putative ABC transport system permease protein